MPNANENNDLPPNISDHDLLIVLHTTMRHMARDVSTIKDDNTQRLAVLEATKYDKEDAAKAIHDAEKVHEGLAASIAGKASKEDLKSLEDRFTKTNDDHETRMRRIERNMYIGLGILGVIQFIIGVIK